jgi:hypothetical protein
MSVDIDRSPRMPHSAGEDDMRVRPVVDVPLSDEERQQAVRLLALIMAACCRVPVAAGTTAGGKRLAR